MEKPRFLHASHGFGLIEIMMALMILTFGLLAVSQLLVASAGLACLARAKDSTATLAQDKLDFLSELYRRSPDSSDLTPGKHGPERAAVYNPIDETILSLYDIQWTVMDVADPRPNKTLNARQVHVEVFPVNSSGDRNLKAFFNRSLTLTTILSPRTP